MDKEVPENVNINTCYLPRYNLNIEIGPLLDALGLDQFSLVLEELHLLFHILFNLACCFHHRDARTEAWPPWWLRCVPR